MRKQLGDMTTLPPVDSYGLQILLPIDVALVASLRACLCVRTVFKEEIMKDMTSTCFAVRQAELVTVVTKVS